MNVFNTKRQMLARIDYLNNTIEDSEQENEVLINKLDSAQQVINGLEMREAHTDAKTEDIKNAYNEQSAQFRMAVFSDLVPIIGQGITTTDLDVYANWVISGQKELPEVLKKINELETETEPEPEK